MRLTSGVLSACLAAVLGLVIATNDSARAGTTGGLSGTVTDAQTHAAVAGVVVDVASPSQNATTTTNAAGRFAFLSLNPDTYVVSTQRQGFDSTLVAGISILADQTQRLALSIQKSLKTIGRVTTRSSLSVVKPGTTTDVYSVGPAQTQAAAPLGGGGSLNNVYSAIASMPGSFVPSGQMGVNQTVYIRGGYYDQIGYEYDGVPVNRSFDNYPAYSGSTLGQQELQSTPAAAAPAQTRPGSPDSSTKSSSPVRSLAPRPSKGKSGRPHFTTICRYSSQVRRPAGSSPITSASAVRTRRSTISISRTAAISRIRSRTQPVPRT